MLVKATRSTPMRFVVWACVLLVLFAVAVPLAHALPAILPLVVSVLDAPSNTTVRHADGDAAPPDLTRAADVPARAPPLA
jgi:hypothetical protein